MLARLSPIVALALVSITSALAQDAPGLKEAKLIIEHNATDLDTGFQGFVDAEGWRRLTLMGPGGDDVMRCEALGAMANQGLTELFFETVEPANADVPIETVLGWLPEGEYRYEGVTAEGGALSGALSFGHAIPAGPELLTPVPDAVVSAGPLMVSWAAVDRTIEGEPTEIVAYQLVIEKDVDPDERMIGKFGLSFYLPATTTSIEVPAGFLEPAATYSWEVLAIATNGNQTLNSSAFSTE